MTYSDFTDIFLPNLARTYRDGQIKFHGLVDFDLWKKIFPDEAHGNLDVQWSAISFNAFTLNDSEGSLLIVFALPLFKTKKEAKFIAFRLDNKRKNIICYSLRRPRFHDDFWQIYLYDYNTRKQYPIAELEGTNSMREFINEISKMPFRQEPSLMDKITSFFD